MTFETFSDNKNVTIKILKNLILNLSKISFSSNAFNKIKSRRKQVELVAVIIVVSTSRGGRDNPGLNPGYSMPYFLQLLQIFFLQSIE